MSKLGELIAELCPNGVKYVKIKDCFNRLKGTPITAGKMKEIENKNGDIRVFAGGKTVINAKEKDIPNANITRVPAVLVQSRGVIDVVYFESPFTFKNEMWAYTHEKKATVKYLYYVLKSNIQSFRDSASGMGSLPQISLPVTEEFIIPLPPLPVQEEIVRILDSFTELTAELTRELTTELTARKKQYEYFENKLLFDNDSELLRLSDICIVNQGLQIPISQRFQEPGEKRYRYITVQFLKNKENEQFYIENPDSNVICSEDDILVTRTGSTGVIVSGVKGCFHNNFFKVTCNELVNQKYMFYLLKSNVMYKRMLAAASGGTVPDLPHKKFYNLSVPIPCIKKQLQIVSILQRFNTLCNDISQGLPAEIKARQQQYEYYRDKLLTFKKKEA